MISPPSLEKVPTSEVMPDPLSLRELFTWEIGAIFSLLLLGLTLQIGGGLLGFLVHHNMNVSAHSTEFVPPNCSQAVVSQ